MEIKNENENLKNLLSYCLGYIKLINPALSRYKIFTEPLTNYLDLNDFNTAENSEKKLAINLKEFYELNPKEITEETKEEYLQQKSIALKLEEIKNKYKVDEFTKQINLNFGYFKVEIPEGTEDSEIVAKEENQEIDNKKTAKINEYPLFYIPINIEFNQNKYFISFQETNIIPNVGFLNGVLSDDSYFELIELFNDLEDGGLLTLPIKKDVVEKIWTFLKAKLRLSEVEFGEDSFILDKYIVSLSAKSNYFLSSDLKNLVQLPEEELMDTSLGSWVSDDDLNNETPISEEGGELFFPFDYDKYQLNALSVINNRAASIEGPPGTGKSQTIANLLCHLAANGKRVLFLSQKAQALKVVKDKLKKLEVDYLYGYIPNRSSPLYSVEEEADGAAYTLSGLSQFINEKRFVGNHDSVTNPISFKELENSFSESIDLQREFTTLHTRFIELQKYNINFPSTQKYNERFDEIQYKELKDLEKSIKDVSDYCGDYIKNSSDPTILDKKYELILEKSLEYELILDKYVESAKVTLYDRDGLVATVANKIVFLKLKPITDKLAKEIYDDLTLAINEKTTKSQKIKKIETIKEYFKYKNSLNKHQALIEEYELKLVELGLDRLSLDTLELLLKEDGVSKTIALTKEVIDLSNKICQLKLTNPNEINKEIKLVKNDVKSRVKYYIGNIIRNQIVSATFRASIRGIVARIAKALTKSKRAYRTFDNLKKDPIYFKTIKELVPVWIMDLEDASRLIPLEKNLFDYIILDEASQCNLAYALPAMYRSKRVVFFGDSLQMRDDSIKFKTNRSMEELAIKFHIPEHLQIKSKDDSVKSVLDIGTLRGFKQETLLCHYRSPKEIIGFSNDYFYAPKKRKLEVLNTNYLPIPKTNRILINHVIEADKTIDISEKTNLSEVKYIVGLINELKSHPSTHDKSIGVLTFFNEQAFLLKEYIKDESIKVSVIEGIQGDERDIIIYSFVLSSPDQKRRYVPLTGEQGEINKELNAGRVNVAFSRARLQVHCVTSLEPESWPEGIWIKRYLQYVEKHGEINFFNKTLKKFDSYFEESFYHFINSEVGTEIDIQNQVESCGFKIDFVVTNRKNNKRLAIECDGPTHFEDENSDVYVESDIERQNILERAGWRFYRLTYSNWIDDSFDKNQIIEDIKIGLDFDGSDDENQIEEQTHIQTEVI
jgi:superfamily I DNA and/or RNA helicase